MTRMVLPTFAVKKSASKSFGNGATAFGKTTLVRTTFSMKESWFSTILLSQFILKLERKWSFVNRLPSLTVYAMKYINEASVILLNVSLLCVVLLNVLAPRCLPHNPLLGESEA